MKASTHVHSALFGGVGRVAVTDLLTAQQAPPFKAVLWCELEPGGSVGAHVQEQYAEIVVGLSGSGEARVNGQRHELTTGSVVHLPLGAVLQLQNGSQEEPLCYLIIKATS